MDINKAAYRDEAHELLSQLEISLLELEERPDDPELIGRIFRSMHTIKGSGSMFGFEGVAEFTHELETVFELIRNGKIHVSKELINVSLLARDQILLMIDSDNDLELLGTSASKKIIEDIWDLVPRDIREEGSGETEFFEHETDLQSKDVFDEHVYWIRFRPNPDLFYFGTNPILLLDEIKTLGECAVIADTRNIPPIRAINPEKCYTGWEIFLKTTCSVNIIREIFLFVEGDGIVDIRRIPHEPDSKNLSEIEPMKELIESLKILSDESLARFIEAPSSFPELFKAEESKKRAVIDAMDTTEAPVVEEPEPYEQHPVETRPFSLKDDFTATSSIRVASDKLDALLNLVGELVTVQARLNQVQSTKNDPEITSIAEEVERLTSELRENTMNIRMLPIGTIFNKFKRLVRDLSRELNKEVSLITEGSDTELDKTVIEKLNDPLIHIIRNSMDHGIESVNTRKALGKPQKGVIKLSASHSGTSVLIRIADDGAGVDPEAVRSKAVKNGFINETDVLTDKEIVRIIFAPGFSTVNKISDVSGRGVGMDVVKRSIEGLRGVVDISSEKGKGTTITLQLPLTLAIIEGLLVRIGEGFFVIPVSAVEECVELNEADADRARRRCMIDLRGDIIPFLDLRAMFNISGRAPSIEPVVIAEAYGDKLGFGVDHVIGHHQTVLKSLGAVYKDIKGVSGATILGDGTVALILDVPQLVKTVSNEYSSLSQAERSY